MTDIACVLIDGATEVEVIYGTPEWYASMEWARFHGLDPNHIPRGSYIKRDAANCRILFDEYVFDDDLIRIVNDEPVIVSRIEQGEARPLPFPVTR